MYTGKQFKNEAGNKVSRQVECRTRQRVQMRDERKVNESYSYSQNVSNSIFQPIKIIQRTHVSINDVGKHSPFEKIAKEMDARNKIDFCNFIIKRNNPQYEIKDGKDDDEVICKNNLPSGREDYYKKITDGLDSDAIAPQNYWINWPAHCTGDLPSMSTAILMGFKHGINIAKYGDIDPKSRLSEVSAYLGGVIDEADNRFIINDDGWKGTYENTSKGRLKFSWLTRVVATGKYEDDKSGLEERIKETGYEESDKDKVRKAWLGKDNVDTEIEFFLKSYGLTPEILKSEKITVLWIRKSGEQGGAHFENDTSFNALKSYIEAYTAGLIILAGNKKGTKTNKLKEIASSRVFDLTEFWNIQDVAKWGGNTRTGQLRLYDYLNRISGNLTHIGSMSGGLEALALIGHNVKFKAKKGEIGVDRMNQYQNTIIKYNRIAFNRCGTIGYKYAGFEKSAAKYFVFFSSGVIQGKVHEDDLRRIYIEKYISTTEYRIKGGGLNGNNARVALTVSRELAREEKRKLKEEIEKRKLKEEIERKKKRIEKKEFEWKKKEEKKMEKKWKKSNYNEFRQGLRPGRFVIRRS